MSFKDTFIEHDLTDEVKAWLEQEIAEQEQRYQAIVKEMDDLSEQREQWYQEFLARIQTYGFNVDGDMKVKISPEDIPVRPDGPHKVVY